LIDITAETNKTITEKHKNEGFDDENNYKLKKQYK